MITFEEAQKTIMQQNFKIDSEKIALSESLGRILAEDIISDMHMPPFNKSAMDGYACKMSDLQNELEVIEVIPAGSLPTKKVLKNHCSKIMTGAVLPEGADCVIMVEHTENMPNNKIRFLKKKTKSNICTKGEDITKGEKLIPKGTLITPQHIAVMASVGYPGPSVSKVPLIGIITTGSELVEPSEKAEGAKIRNSNGHQLIAQVASLKARPKYYGIAGDTKEKLSAVIKKAVAEVDILILSGGVSKGDFDYVPEVLEENNINILFNRVAVQPGKPITFAKTDKIYCFALPGNPVATFVQFEMLIKPFIYMCMGHSFSPKIMKLKLAETIKRKRSERKSFIPMLISKESTLRSLEYHGSADINAVSKADVLISMEQGITEIKAGTLVDAQLIV